MAWSTPGTAVTGATATAAFWNQNVRDNLAALNPLDSVGATSWAPTLEATTTDPSGADTGSGAYWRAGPMVIALARFTWSSEQAGSGTYFVTLPITASGLSANTTTGQAMGAAYFKEDGVNVRIGVPILATTSTVRFVCQGETVVTSAVPFTWGTNDLLSFVIAYPAA